MSNDNLMKPGNFSCVIAVLILFLVTGFSSVMSQSLLGGFEVSPGRIELDVKPGNAKTASITTDYSMEGATTALANIRIAVKAEDWGLSPIGQVLSGPAGTMPRSATSWLMFSPAEFTIASGKKQVIRFTFSVPKGTTPGDYYTAIYVADRTPPPPDEKKLLSLNIRYRFYSLIYVMVPNLTRKNEITNVTAGIDKGLPVVKASLKNTGNSHIRSTHSVEFRDETDRVVAEIPKHPATVLLGDSELTQTLRLDKPLAPGQYKVVYTNDAGKGMPIKVGTTILEVTAADALAAAKAVPENKAPATDAAKPAESKPAAAPPPVTAAAAATPSPKKP